MHSPPRAHTPFVLYPLLLLGIPDAPKNAYEWEFTSVLLLCEKDGKENNKIKQNKAAITWTALSGRNEVTCAHNFPGVFTHGNSWSLPPEEPGLLCSFQDEEPEAQGVGVTSPKSQSC